MIVAFTGPTEERTLGRLAMALLMRDLAEAEKMGKVTEVRTGAAYGIDTFAYNLSKLTWPFARHRVFVPKGKWHNETLVVAAREAGDDIIEVEGGYMKRNDALVKDINLLCAFPQTDHEELRSGTWATVRRARKQQTEFGGGPLVWIQPLDELHRRVLALQE